MSTEADRKFSLHEVRQLRKAWAMIHEEEQWVRDWLKHDYDSGKSPYRTIDLTKKRA